MKFICRATAYFTGGKFGLGIGPIFAEQLRCNGYETNINQCNYVPNVHCTHSTDVGIMCTGKNLIHGCFSGSKIMAFSCICTCLKSDIDIKNESF